MKTIPLRSDGDIPLTANLIKEIIGVSPKGMTVTQLRSRIRILDALDKPENDSVILEDAEFTTLTEIVNDTGWVRADRQVLQIIDDILTAK